MDFIYTVIVRKLYQTCIYHLKQCDLCFIKMYMRYIISQFKNKNTIIGMVDIIDDIIVHIYIFLTEKYDYITKVLFIYLLSLWYVTTTCN